MKEKEYQDMKTRLLSHDENLRFAAAYFERNPGDRRVFRSRPPKKSKKHVIEIDAADLRHIDSIRLKKGVKLRIE